MAPRLRIIRWLQTRCYCITMSGLAATLVIWIVLSKGFGRKYQPPRHYLDINPPKENNFYHFDKDLPIEVYRQGDAKHVLYGVRPAPPETNERIRNIVLYKAQEEREAMREKAEAQDDLIEPLDQKVPPNIEAEEEETAAPKINFILDSNVKDSVFKEALRHSTDSNNNVMLSIVDSHYMEFALNFHEGSLMKNNVSNFLLICIDESVIVELHKNNIDCFHYGITQEGDDHNSTTFGSPAYFIKTNVKTRVMMHALTLGFNVLFVDLDVVLFKNPMLYLKNASYDLQISMDRTQWNTGFMYARPTNATLMLFKTAWSYFLKYHKAHDQAYVAMELRPMLRNKSINVLELPPTLFPNGYYYFQYDKRFFRNLPACPECVMAHNNYVGTADAKIYRFKENFLWGVDSDGYYSDPRARYLLYNNPESVAQTTWMEEVQALHNAFTLAELSERILVLPTFRCCDCKSNTCAHPKHKCSLMHVLKVNAINAKYARKYREHVFFENAKVPEALRESVDTAPMLSVQIPTATTTTVAAAAAAAAANLSAHNDFTFTCSGGGSECSKADLKTWLRKYDDFSVIKFHSLYGNIAGDATADNAYKCGEYEQWEVKVEL